MRKIVICFLFVICFLSTLATAGTFHYYFNGRVRAVSDSNIQVETRRFTIAPGCKVILIQNRNKAFFEDPARINDIHPGESVSVRVEGSRVDEIRIERWKR